MSTALLCLQVVCDLSLLLDIGQYAVSISTGMTQSLVAQGEQPPQQLSLILGIYQLRLQL